MVIAINSHSAASSSIIGEGGILAFFLLLSITLVSMRQPGRDSKARQFLVCVGLLGMIPSALMTAALATGMAMARYPIPLTFSSSSQNHGSLVDWAILLGIPIIVAYLMRGRAAWKNLVSALWVMVLFESMHHGPAFWMVAFIWGLGGIGMAVWGFLERAVERIVLGVLMTLWLFAWR